jgi:hypothetical protein
MRVALQYEPTLDEPSRERRGAMLRQRFEEAVEESGADIALYPETLSVSGQMIEASVPSERLHAIAAQLGGHDVRLDVVRSLHFS